MNIAIAVSEFLADKQNLVDHENDSINIVDNSIYSWNFANIPQPSAEELQACFDLANAKNNQAAVNAKALQYLADTDYLVIRSIDDPTKPVNEEIKQLRAEARLKIVR